MTPQLFAIDGGSEDEGGDELFEDLPPTRRRSPGLPTLHGRQRSSTPRRSSCLESLGATVVEEYPKVDGYPLDFLVEGPNGGACSSTPGAPRTAPTAGRWGLRRQDTVLKFGQGDAPADRGCPHLLVLVTAPAPARVELGVPAVELNDAPLDVVATVGDPAGRRRPQHYLTADLPPGPIDPLPALWREVQLRLTFTVGADETDDDEEDGDASAAARTGWSTQRPPRHRGPGGARALATCR